MKHETISLSAAALAIASLGMSALTCCPLAAQAGSAAVFPSNYAGVSEGPGEERYRPFGGGVSRSVILYESWDVRLPVGHQITRVGFREDRRSRTPLQLGHSVYMEVRMGYSRRDSDYSASRREVQDDLYDPAGSGPTTVFGPAMVSLPNLRDPQAPLTDGQIWIDLQTPFTFDPAMGNLLVDIEIYQNSNGNRAFDYRMDVAGSFSPVTDSPASTCGSQGGGRMICLPTLVGSDFTALLGQVPALSTCAFILGLGQRLGNPVTIPGFPSDCRLYVNLGSATIFGLATDGFGRRSISIDIPDDPTIYHGWPVSAQAVTLDFFAPSGVNFSNASEVVVYHVPASRLFPWPQIQNNKPAPITFFQ